MATIITITDSKIKLVSGLSYDKAVDAGKDFQNETGLYTWNVADTDDIEIVPNNLVERTIVT
jgi:hypothetical protein